MSEQGAGSLGGEVARWGTDLGDRVTLDHTSLAVFLGPAQPEGTEWGHIYILNPDKGWRPQPAA